MARPGDRADRAGRPRRIIGSVGFHAPPGAGRPGRGRLSRRAGVPAARASPRRSSARCSTGRAREHGVDSLPGVGLARQRRLARDRPAGFGFRQVGDPDRRHRRRGARLRARRLAATTLSRRVPSWPGMSEPDDAPALVRHAGRPRRRRARRADRGRLAADLPDLAPTPRTASAGRGAATSTRARRTRPASASSARSRPSRAGAHGIAFASGSAATAAIAELAGAGRRGRRRRRRLRRDVPLPRAGPARRRASTRATWTWPAGPDVALGGADRADPARLVRDAVEPATSRSSTSRRSSRPSRGGRPRAAGGRSSSSTTRSPRRPSSGR